MKDKQELAGEYDVCMHQEGHKEWCQAGTGFQARKKHLERLKEKKIRSSSMWQKYMCLR